MSTTKNNQPPNQPVNRPQPHHSPLQNQQAMTEERIKQAIMDTLIELNLVPKPQKKKALTNV